MRLSESFKSEVGGTEKIFLLINCFLIVSTVWGSWGSWGECSTSCAEGLSTRTRPCDGDGLCEDTSQGSETQACNLRTCPSKSNIFKKFVFPTHYYLEIFKCPSCAISIRMFILVI